MTSFDYRLNPLYPIKECSSCGALYTTDCCCSERILGDKIICDLGKTPDLSQRSPQNCPKCGNPVDGHYCQGCALLRKKLKEDFFTYCIENRILQDSFESSNDNTNVVNALRETFVGNQNPDKNSSQSPPQINHHCCYGCGDPLKVPIVPNPEPFNNQTIKELPPTVPSFASLCCFEDENSFTYDSTSNLVHDSPNVFDPPPQPPFYSCEFCGNDTCYGHYCTPQIPACYDDDNDDYTFVITPNDPDNTLSMGDEHLDTISATESNEFIKSSVENLVLNPSESEGEYECDVPACEVFTTFSNILFDTDYDFYSSDDQSVSDEDVPKKIFSNPLFDEEIISMKIGPHHFNAEYDLIESLLNHDSSIISSSLKIDSLFDEFPSELTLLKSSPSGIDETDCDPEEEAHFIKRLLYDNLSSRPPKEFVYENSDAAIESFSSSLSPSRIMTLLWKKLIYLSLRITQCRWALRKMTMTLKRIFSSLKYCLAIIPFHFLKMSHFILIFLHSLVLLQNHQMLNSTVAKITEQMTSITSLCEMACTFIQKKLEEKQLEEERVAKAQNWKLPVCYDDDDDEERSDSLDENIISELPPFSAITPDEPVLFIEEPDNSQSTELLIHYVVGQLDCLIQHLRLEPALRSG
nr:hypothetical protein [Tanacetum cinerariifolium]